MGVPSLGCRGPVRSEGEDRGREKKEEGACHRLDTQSTGMGGRVAHSRCLPRAGAQMSVSDNTAHFREIPGVLCCAANPMDTGFKLGSSVLHQAVPGKTLLCC